VPQEILKVLQAEGKEYQKELWSIQRNKHQKW
jgi:hypothetical protein